MILGTGFLTGQKTIFDFESQTLIIGNSVYPLKTMPDQEQSAL